MKNTLVLAALLGLFVFSGVVQARDRDDLDRIRIEGRIESIRGQMAIVRDDCGTRFRVHLGPQWYWDECNYYLRSGCYVTIIAWQDLYDDFCYAGEIRGDDFCYDLCDSRGYPLWRDYHDCDDHWRPTRSFFQICFVIGDPLWHCSVHRHFWDCHDGCWHGHPRHRTWYSHDDRDHDRHGRRDYGGGRHNVENDDDRRPPASGGDNVQIERPRATDKSPGKGSIRSESSSKKSGKSYSSSKSSGSSRSYSKPVIKSERKVNSSVRKSFAHK